MDSKGAIAVIKVTMDTALVSSIRYNTSRCDLSAYMFAYTDICQY